MSPDEKSRALHAAVADKMREDPAVLERARERVVRWLRDGAAHPYAAAWSRALALPVDDLRAFLTDDGEEARTLRQASPFAGALDPRERWAILRSLARRA